jgi:hypothetical protein
VSRVYPPFRKARSPAGDPGTHPAPGMIKVNADLRKFMNTACLRRATAKAFPHAHPRPVTDDSVGDAGYQVELLAGVGPGSMILLFS